jgi:biotin carboxylase
VQEFARGQRYDVYALVREGQLLAGLQTRVLRTDRADGTGVTVEAVTVALSEVLREQCALVSGALKLTGPAYFQFHYDEERGSSHLLEVNPRLGVNFVITAHCGWNFPASAVKLARGEPLSDSETGFSYPLGRRYAWSWGDLSGLRRELRFRQIGLRRGARWLADLVVTFVRADVHVTWSWADPLPTLALYGSHFAKGASRALGRGSAGAGP